MRDSIGVLNKRISKMSNADRVDLTDSLHDLNRYQNLLLLLHSVELKRMGEYWNGPV